MGKSPEQKMAVMVDGAQPHCPEPVEAAMICSHAGSMSSVLLAAATRLGGIARTSELPNPVLIAVTASNVHVFKYKPKGFKVKIKNGAEVARWPRASVQVEADEPGMVAQFSIATDQGDFYALEVPTAMGGREVYEAFIDTLRRPPS